MRPTRNVSNRAGCEASPRAALSPADWIAAATDVLVKKGVDSIKIDLLSKDLGVTKGSFYWHFSNRDDLLRHVLLRWRELQTEVQIARYRAEAKRGELRVRELAELPFRGHAAERGAAVELAIRAWARRDEMARQVVDEVDATRLSYLTDLFLSLDCSADEAAARAFLLYSYMQSEALFYRQGTDRAKGKRRHFTVELLLGGIA